MKKSYAQVVQNWPKPEPLIVKIENQLFSDIKDNDVVKIIISFVQVELDMRLLTEVGLGNVGEVLKLLDAGADPDSKNMNGRTCLIYAAKLGYVDIVGILLKRGANIEAKNHKGRTALFLAIKKRNDNVVKLLLEYGARTDVEDMYGYDLEDLHFKSIYSHLVPIDNI